MGVFPAEQKEKLEEIKECQEDFASAQELRAYIQRYVDCIQVMYHMGGERELRTEVGREGG